MKYSAILRNDQGCCFDRLRTNNLKTIARWATGRGGNYDCTVWRRLAASEQLCLISEYVKGRKVSSTKIVER